MGEAVNDKMRAVTLGKDLRFLLVAVGGGAIKVARDVARRDISYLETVAVNCDRRVLEERLFGRQILLKLPGEEDPSENDIGVSEGMLRAHASKEAIADIFRGGNCVTIVASLGGGSGSGILPVLLDIATKSRDLVHLTVFLIMPFQAEERHRLIAEHTLANLYFLEGLNELKESGRAHVIHLDNEDTLRRRPHEPISHVTNIYGDLVTAHIEKYINAGKVATTVDWIADGEVIGGPASILNAQPAQASMVPTESFDISEAASARLSEVERLNDVAAGPRMPVPGNDIILDVQALPAAPELSSGEKPKIPPLGPQGPSPGGTP